MSLSFNTNGNLHKNVELSFNEFVTLFGTNPSRRKKIDNAVLFFKIFKSCRCTTVYIGGSFVSNKKNPDDIDMCFDLTEIDNEELKRTFPEFFDFNKIGEIRRKYDCQIWHFDQENTYMLKLLQYDTDDYPKGLVKLNLQEIENYDQK